MSRLITSLMLFFASFSSSLLADEAVFSQVGRIVAVGDLHGDYEQYVEVLKSNRLVDDKLRWRGGDTHFVQLGDVTDRGPDSLKIIRHLMKLEKQAKKAGGKVHVLIGNHEAMNVHEDLRYVHADVFAQLVDRRSRTNRNRYLAAVYQAMLANQPELAADKSTVMKRLNEHYPLGYVEHRQLWAPGREIAKWYAAKSTVIQINDTIFLHGGLNPHQNVYPTLDEINQTVRDEFAPGAEPVLSIDPEGPLWYRGLANAPAETELEPLTRMLAFYDADRIVVAHTPTAGAIMPRFGGKVILADVGISAYYGSAMANVLLDESNIFAIHRGEQIPLPADNIDAYLDRVAALEPGDTRLTRFVEKRSTEQSQMDSVDPAAMGPDDNASTGQRVSN